MLPILFSETSLGIAHPSNLVFGYVNSGTLTKKTISIEHEKNTQVRIADAGGLDIEKVFENKNWTRFEISLSESDSGKFKSKILLELTEPSSERAEKITIPVLAFIQ